MLTQVSELLSSNNRRTKTETDANVDESLFPMVDYSDLFSVKPLLVLPLLKHIQLKLNTTFYFNITGYYNNLIYYNNTL